MNWRKKLSEKEETVAEMIEKLVNKMMKEHLNIQEQTFRFEGRIRQDQEDLARQISSYHSQ